MQLLEKEHYSIERFIKILERDYVLKNANYPSNGIQGLQLSIPHHSK